jgi:hypothetical protein
MINLDVNQPGKFNVIYLDSASAYVGTTEFGIELDYTQDYSLTVTGSLQTTLLNTPSQIANYIVFTTDLTGFPSASGQYTVDTVEFHRVSKTWSQANYKFSEIHRKWSEGFLGGHRTISNDRAYFVSSDEPTYDKYLSLNENGSYIVYDG